MNTVLSQDLLETVVEGPEGDSIYEIYVDDEDSQQVVQNNGNVEERKDGDENDISQLEGEAEVDMEVYAAMDVDDGSVDII